MLKVNEARYIETIKLKDERLRDFISNHHLPKEDSEALYFNYLSGLKSIIGNFHNDISFIASLLAKRFLQDRFDRLQWDAAEKAQGAPGLDIDINWQSARIIGEIKTTIPYQKGFGSSQKTAIKKDLDKLQNHDADFKFMMVTSEEAYQTLRQSPFNTMLDKVEVVNLVSGDSFKLDDAI